MKKLLLLLTFILSQGLIAAPIHDAAERGDVNEVRRILNDNRFSRFISGNRVNSSDGNRGTPLHLAAMNGHFDVARLLVARGANVNSNAIIHRGNPICCVAVNGNLDIADFLISHGANVNATDINGITPLHIASTNGHLSLIQFFIKKGAKVNAIDKWMTIAPYMAAERGNLEVVDLLISNGAYINAVDLIGETILHIASFNGHRNIVERLLANKLCEPGIKNNDGNTAEDLARLNGHNELADFIKTAHSVKCKIINSDCGLQILSAVAANKNGIGSEEIKLVTDDAKSYIENIRNAEYRN